MKRTTQGLAVAFAALGLAAPAHAAPVKQVPVLKQDSATKYQLGFKWGKAPSGTRWTALKRTGR